MLLGFFFNPNNPKDRARDDFTPYLNHRPGDTTATTTVSSTDHTLFSLKPKQKKKSDLGTSTFQTLATHGS